MYLEEREINSLVPRVRALSVVYLGERDINRRVYRREGINRRVSRREGNKQSCISGSEHYLSCNSERGI